MHSASAMASESDNENLGTVRRLLRGLSSRVMGGDDEASDNDDSLDDSQRAMMKDALASNDTAAGRTGGARLFQAASRGDADVLATLLKAGESPNAVDADGATLLKHAAFDGGGSVECVRVLLEAKADVENAGKARGGSSAESTPLLISAVTGMADVVEVLLEYGARTDGGPRSNETFGQPSLPTLIVVSGLICKMSLDEPSHNQMRTRYERIFRLLLGKADKELKLICLLRVASLNCAGAVKIIGMLLADGVDPDGIARGRENRHGKCEVHYPAIWAACSSKAPLCLQALLAAGANPSLSILDFPSKTPMSIAKEYEDKECISLLNGALRRGKGLVGCHVLVEGFRRAKPAINGRQGMVLGFEDDTGLCRVQVEFGKGYCRTHDLPPTVLVEVEVVDGDEESEASTTDDKIDAKFELILAVWEGRLDDVVKFLAAGVDPNFDDGVTCGNENTDLNLSPLRAAVHLLEEEQYSSDACAVLGCVLAARADPDYVVPTDGWCFADKQSPRLVKMMDSAERLAQLRACEMIQRVQEGSEAELPEPDNERSFIQSMYNNAVDAKLGKVDIALLMNLAHCVTAEDDSTSLLWPLLFRGADPNITIKFEGKVVSPLGLAYHLMTKVPQPNRTLQLLLAAGASPYGTHWSLVESSMKLDDRVTLDLLEEIADLRPRVSPKEPASSPTARYILSADEAAYMLLAHAGEYSESVDAVRRFAGELPGSVRLCRLVMSLVEQVSLIDVKAKDEEGVANTHEAEDDMVAEVAAVASADE